MSTHRIEIYSPKLVGQRFEDHMLPLEMMEDIGALEDVTIEMAKWLYLKNNPERQRIPRGFTNGISIKLESIEPGSTKLKIAMFVASTGLFPSSKTQYFEQASENLVHAIQAAENNDDVTEYMPEKFLSYFNKIGRKLQSDESIEFSPEMENKARLTKETRKRLILAASSVKEYLDEVVLRGYISEMNKVKNTFQIQLLDGQLVSGKYNNQFVSELLDAFNNYEDKQLIKIVGIGQFNRTDKIEILKRIESLEFLDKKDVPSRLQIISQLKDGWLNGEGKALVKEQIEWFSSDFEEFFSPEIELPYFYPTPNGGLQAEWSINDNEISFTIDLESKIGLYHSLSLIDNKEKELEIGLTPEGWDQLNRELLNIIS